MPPYLVNALPSLFHWNYDDTDLLEACLTATGLDRAAQADLVLEAISFHTEQMSPQLLFALVGVRGRLGSNEDRLALVKDLIAHMRLGLDRPASPPVLGAAAPEDLDRAMAGFLAALMGDVDKQVRWRAAHAAVQLSHRGPLVAELVACLSGEAARPFQAPGLPTYHLACVQQLAAVFERIACQAPARIAPHAPLLVRACLDGPPHALARNLLKRALLRLRASGLGAGVSESDCALVALVNVSPFAVAARPGRDVRAELLQQGRPFRERPELRFDFDETDTLPYWYAPAGQVFGLGSYEVAQRAERWICDAWGHGPEAVRWAAEPRQARFGDDHFGTTSHRHGSEPTLERLSRHLEWHALHCVMGELISEQPTVEQYYGNGWHDWMADRDFSTPSAWLAELRTPPPLEARLWRDPGHGLADHDAWLGPLSEDAFANELTAAGDGRLVVRGSFSLRAPGPLEQHVAVHSALVTPGSATALARALQSIASHQDFLVPTAGDHGEIDEPGHRLHGWLEEIEREPRFDRADEARGEVSSLKISPGKAARALGLERRSVQTRWSRDGGQSDELTLDWWGTGDDRDLTRGWRADASVDLLQDLLSATKRSLLLSVEITRRSGEGDDVERDTRWRIFLFRRDGTLEPFKPRRRDPGRYLVRKLGLGEVDILGRWLAHEIAELHALVGKTKGAAHLRAQAKLTKLVAQLQRHRSGRRY
jgi:hypothetical protein